MWGMDVFVKKKYRRAFALDKHYRINTWTHVEPDKPEIYSKIEDALSQLEILAQMQPENIFQVVECDKNGSLI
jgi:hypothetical protein